MNPPAPGRPARRIGRVVAIAAAATLIVPALAIGWRSYREEVSVFFPPRRPVQTELAAAGLTGALPVTFGSPGSVLRGWYAPSSNGAALVLVHGAGGDRASLLPEARALQERGFGVLSFDLPGHGESEGSIRWNDGERIALRAALDFVSERKDVTTGRIGALGFSLGGYVLAQVAAADQRVRAVVLTGTPSDPIEQAHFQHRRWSLLSQLPALFALRRGGMSLDVRARDYVDRIAPRPLLVVSGTDDGTVPLAMAQELFDRAREPRELLVIPGAGHGDYATRSPEYLKRVLEFFERALTLRP
jgi:pimeloyl-ACP methyl ester carboxylesterase